MANTLKAIQMKRKLTQGAPAAGNLLVGELVINMATNTIYTKNQSNQVVELGIQAGGGTISGNLQVNGRLGVTGAVEFGDTLKVAGMTMAKKGGIDSYLGFPNAATMIRSNAIGQLVLGGTSGSDVAKRAIFVRPKGENESSGESIFSGDDGGLTTPRLTTPNLIATTATFSGTTTYAAGSRLSVEGAFVVTNNATINGSLTVDNTIASGSTIQAGKGNERVVLVPTTTANGNPSLRFYSGGNIRAEIFGMGTATAGSNTAMQIRPVSNPTLDLNLQLDGTVSAYALQSRNNARILSPDTTNWSQIVFADSNNAERGILFADQDGAIGLRNRNGIIAVWNQNNVWQIQKGSLNVGANAGGDQKGNDPYTKGVFFNRGFIECYGVNAGTDAQHVSMIRGTHGGTSWVSSLYSERTNAGIVQTVIAAQDGEHGAWYVFRHDGQMVASSIRLTGVLSAEDVEIRSDRKAKSNIKSIENALDKVCQLDGSTYILNSSNKISAGLIAQDVEKVLPEAVTCDTEGDKLLRLNYNGIIGLLVNSIKELREEVKELRGE